MLTHLSHLRAAATAVVSLLLPAVFLRLGVHAVAINGRDPAEALVAVLWLGALLSVTWLALGTALALLGAAVPAWSSLRAIGSRLPTRRLMQPLLAASLVSSAALATSAPAFAAQSPSATADPSVEPGPAGAVQLSIGADGRFVVRAPRTSTESPKPAPTAPRAPTSTTTTTTAAPPAAKTPTARPRSSAPSSTLTTPPRAAAPHATRPAARVPEPTTSREPAHGGTTHVVEPGDHLWGLATSALQRHLGRVPTDAEIAPYWRTVCERNTPALRSGDPDLIFPGEVVTLPAL